MVVVVEVVVLVVVVVVDVDVVAGFFVDDVVVGIFVDDVVVVRSDVLVCLTLVGGGDFTVDKVTTSTELSLCDWSPDDFPFTMTPKYTPRKTHMATMMMMQAIRTEMTTHRFRSWKQDRFLRLISDSEIKRSSLGLDFFLGFLFLFLMLWNSVAGLKSVKIFSFSPGE